MNEIDRLLSGLTGPVFVRRKFKSIKRATRKRNDRKYEEGAAMDEVTQSEYFLSASSLNDHYISKCLSKRIESGLTTISSKESFICSQKEWHNYIRNHLSEYPNQLMEFGHSTGMILDTITNDFTDYTVNSNLVEVKLFGSKEYVQKMYQQLGEVFDVATCYIEWVHGSNGESVTIPLLPEKLPISEMYPFLDGETIEQYYNRFLESSAAILLLIGPPGTGKTTFIRGLLHHAGKNAIVTYDDKILDRDYIFARFIEDDMDVMVIEDADNFLKSRADGNTMMHRFLNVGDGLISTKGKKLIFSTNLPSVSDVDDALIRPGRCFDIVNFENYNKEQAVTLSQKLGLGFTVKGTGDTYSLAEIFHQQKNANPKQKRKMGFV